MIVVTPISVSDAVPDPDPDSPKPDQPDQPSGKFKRVPTLVTMTRAERDRAERRRWLLRSWPALLFALVLHGLLLWQLWLWYPEAKELFLDLTIRATVDDEVPAELVPDEVEDEPLEELEEVFDPEITEFEPSESESDTPVEDVLGLGGSGGGRGVRGRRGGDALERFEDVTGSGGGSSGFGAFIRSVRERGLDVVFVVDATASMGKFLAQARLVIDDIIGDLSEIVPSQRVGIVAYRDVTDAWLTRHVDITDDRYHVQNFLIDLDPVGGGDFEEAVDVGLDVAFDQLTWREDSHRVIIVVGDAPAHPDDEQKMLAAVRSFVRLNDATLSVLYTGVDPEIRKTSRDTSTRKSMERLAQTGGGFMSELADDAEVLRSNVLEMSFGRKWFEDVRRLLSLREVDRRQKILAKKVARENRAWIVNQLRRDPVPSIVAACVTLWDRTIADAALDLLLDERGSPLDRHAGLYILKRKLDPDAFIDIALPLAEQEDLVAKLRKKIARLPKTQGRVVKPAPPPPRAAPGG